MKSRLLLLLPVFVAALHVSAGGSTEDYSRALSLARRTEGKVFRDAIAPHWLPDHRHFWYRVTTGPDTNEFVLVDAATGEIQRAASAEKLGLPGNERLSTSAPRPPSPRRTTHTGAETSIRLSNTTAGPVEVFWVDENGDRRPYGRILPGQARELHTYAGHVWLVTDALGGPLGFFEATPDVLEATIDGRPAKLESPGPSEIKPGHQPVAGRKMVRAV